MTPEIAALDQLLARASAESRADLLEEVVRACRDLVAQQPGQAAAHLLLGKAALRLGDRGTALVHLKAALQANPRVAEHWSRYIDALIDDGQLGAAGGMLQQAETRGLPATAVAALRARIGREAAARGADFDRHFAAGRFAEMEKAARARLAAAADDAAAWKALATAIALQGRAGEALPALQQALTLLPRDVQVHNNLGNALRELGRAAEAEARYRQALILAPEDIVTHCHLAMALADLRRLPEAEQCCRHAAALSKNDADAAEAQRALGWILHRQARLTEAAAAYRRALALRPGDERLHLDLAVVRSAQGEPAEAAQLLRRAIELDPGYAEAMSSLGTVLNDLGEAAEADEMLQRALALKPDLVEAHANRCTTLINLGQQQAAEESLRRAIEARPADLKLRSMLLFNLNYLEYADAGTRLTEARRYGELARAAAVPYRQWRCAAPPERLRIGFVSGDLCTHPVGYFLDALFPALAAAGLELCGYPTAVRADALTARLRQHCLRWQTLAGLDDGAAAAAIHGDGVHILIDLSGHTAQQRLPLFTWRPAPVQATWLGYFATTGLAEIDYLIADPVGAPAAAHPFFVESVATLPETRLCFSAPAEAPAVAPLPALARGHISFGCFQNLGKINDRVLAAWAEILAAIPDARLYLQSKALGDAGGRAALERRLMASGIAPERVTLRGKASRAEYLAAYAEVDIALDTFPYPGGTTTCEALWMGVPTVTLAGDSMLSRQGASLLTAAGLTDWVAADFAQYVALAVARAGDPAALATLRGRLRASVGGSPLMDAARFARHFSALLWRVWGERGAAEQLF